MGKRISSVALALLAVVVVGCGTSTSGTSSTAQVSSSPIPVGSTSPAQESTSTPKPTHKATHKPTPKPKPAMQWYSVATVFSTNHMEMRSHVFTLKAKPTRADWAVSPKTPHYNCTMFLIPASDTPDSTNATFITMQSSGGTDASNSSGKQVIHVKAGRYYIWATSNNCFWQVIMMQGQ
jgi:hypothetical protein